VPLHAAVGFNGIDGWNIASCLQHEVLAGHGLSTELRQQSDGAMAAIELAAAPLAAGTDRAAALITASDRFVLPLRGRRRACAGLVPGDGASAAVPSRRSGLVRVLSVVANSRPELGARPTCGPAVQAGRRPARHRPVSDRPDPPYWAREGLLVPGRRVMPTGIGLGFDRTTAVIEILRPPTAVESVL
jgi:hypothetical protein